MDCLEYMEPTLAKPSCGAQGHSALSAATVLHSRIHICGIIIKDKYYQVQSERVLCICAGAKKRGAVKLNTGLGRDHRRA